ncbi:hypothetical protein XENTR_v10016066 [Xenopus tropicalis]|nr:hypothetical protein XENTR_v10016066 [Xenopus tropicalis]
MMGNGPANPNFIITSTQTCRICCSHINDYLFMIKKGYIYSAHIFKHKRSIEMYLFHGNQFCTLFMKMTYFHFFHSYLLEPLFYGKWRQPSNECLLCCLIVNYIIHFIF